MNLQDSEPFVRNPPETTTTSTASLFLLKYWATMRVEVSLTKPTPIPEVGGGRRGRSQGVATHDDAIAEEHLVKLGGERREE